MGDTTSVPTPVLERICGMVYATRGEQQRLAYINDEEYGEMVRLRHGGHSAVETVLKALAKLEQKGDGTYACPICGCSSPHAHSPEQVAEWRNSEIAPELCERCLYCRGDVANVQRKAVRNENGFWFHHPLPECYWDRHAAPCHAQEIQDQIYRLEQKGDAKK